MTLLHSSHTCFVSIQAQKLVGHIDDDGCNKCLDGWNQFPSDDQLPGFRTTVTAYFDACADLADRLAVIMAKGLGVPAAANSPMIRELRKQHSSYLRSNYYPPCDDTDRTWGYLLTVMLGFWRSCCKMSTPIYCRCVRTVIGSACTLNPALSLSIRVIWHRFIPMDVTKLRCTVS